MTFSIRLRKFHNTDLDELYDQEVTEGKRSYAEAIIAAGLVSKEDLVNLVSQFLGYELQVEKVKKLIRKQYNQ